MSDAGLYRTLVVLVCVVCACVAVQRYFKKVLDRDQYFYLKDISLIAAWALCGLWAGSAPMRLTIAAGLAAALIGFCQKVLPRAELRFAYLLVGAALALSGPRISFIGLPDGEFHYLAPWLSVLLTALWVGFFPILIQELDEIPGMAGYLLTAGWGIMLLASLLSSQDLSEALLMAAMGLALVLAFFSRHINAYRRLGEPLAALWGTLLAGTSILGVSKGIAFSTLMAVPLAFFALPILETSLNLVSLTVSPKPLGNMILYRRLVGRGMEHPAALLYVTLLCAGLGIWVAWFQIALPRPFLLGSTLLVTAAGAGILLLRRCDAPASRDRRPGLWRVQVDNVSLHYALGKVRGFLLSGEGAQVITVDALAALLSRRNEAYARTVREASLVLPDGTGLVWAMKFLGSPIQERLPGVEFVEHLCRQASGEGWPVYFLGGRPGVADDAARKLQERLPGLAVAGCRDGYFRPDEVSELLEGIRKSGARVLFVGLGVPKQELWIREHLSELGSVVAMGMGGSMDVLSGRLRRAPRVWQRTGMEWLYRLIQEPWRWRRIARLPLFVFLVLLTRLGLIAREKGFSERASS
jgi:N-acetylglucosaminyldiphosphoundecaprenol N-acetyl-beta-D-mannosaminyltransferase